MFTRLSVYAGAPAALVALPVYAASGSAAGTAVLTAAAVLAAAAGAPAVHARWRRKALLRNLVRLAGQVTAASARVRDAPTGDALVRACAAILGMVEDDRARIPADTDLSVIHQRLRNVADGLERYLYFQDRPGADEAVRMFRELAPVFADEMAGARADLIDDHVLGFQRAIDRMRLESGPYLPFFREGER
ncbi:hypothetical protein AB0H71_33575 [Nocardia sp. NPDC050697]|uniref:hypothetical protein n=1 Tax=Nocardia sp. NPDC050697 TaxID=3155158 RepID=UPI0033DD7F90